MKFLYLTILSMDRFDSVVNKGTGSGYALGLRLRSLAFGGQFELGSGGGVYLGD